MRTTTKRILVALVAMGAIAGALCARGSQTVDADLAQTAREMSVGLPRMVDPSTRWESVIAGPGYRFEYTFTLTEFRADDAALERIYTALQPALRQSTCTSGAMRYFFDNGVDVVYVYRTEDGKWRRTVSISLLDCGPRDISKK